MPYYYYYYYYLLTYLHLYLLKLTYFLTYLLTFFLTYNLIYLITDLITYLLTHRKLVWATPLDLSEQRCCHPGVNLKVGEEEASEVCKEEHASCVHETRISKKILRILHFVLQQRSWLIHYTTVSIKTNPLAIFFPSSFYLISWCCCSKQKSRKKSKADVCTVYLVPTIELALTAAFFASCH